MLDEENKELYDKFVPKLNLDVGFREHNTTLDEVSRYLERKSAKQLAKDFLLSFFEYNYDHRIRSQTGFIIGEGEVNNYASFFFLPYHVKNYLVRVSSIPVDNLISFVPLIPLRPTK